MAVVDDEGQQVYPDWAALGREVKRRREAMRLPQDLTNRGGPGEITVRKIERGEGATVQPRTWARLEHALATAEGWVDRIIHCTPTDDDLNPRIRHVRGTLTATVSPPGIASRAQVGTPTVRNVDTQSDSTHQYRTATDTARAVDTVGIVDIPVEVQEAIRLAVEPALHRLAEVGEQFRQLPPPLLDDVARVFRRLSEATDRFEQHYRPAPAIREAAEALAKALPAVAEAERELGRRRAGQRLDVPPEAWEQGGDSDAAS